MLPGWLASFLEAIMKRTSVTGDDECDQRYSGRLAVGLGRVGYDLTKTSHRPNYQHKMMSNHQTRVRYDAKLVGIPMTGRAQKPA